MNTDDKGTIPQYLELEVTEVTHSGRGLARKDNRSYFVRRGLPGDKVLCSIQPTSDRFIDATIVEYLTKSTLRRPPPCNFFEKCGGCQWMEMDYSAQFASKKRAAVACLNRTLNPPIEEQNLLQIPSPEVLHYRLRCVLHCESDSSGKAALGYFAEESHNHIAIDPCLVLHKDINRFIHWFNEQAFSLSKGLDLKFEIQCLPQASALNEPSLILVIHGDFENPESISLINALRANFIFAWIGTAREKKAAPIFLHEVIEGINYYHAVGHFQQANTAANHLLRDLVKSLVIKMNPQTILDLFCGNGNLTLGLAKDWKGIELIGVDNSQQAIKAAKMGACDYQQQNPSSRVEYIAADCEQFMWSNYRKGRLFDCIIVDPPREGLMKMTKPITLMKPDNLIYVSCEPQSLAHDLARLRKEGYHIESLTCLDLFPQTPHLEIIVHLKSQNPKL